MAVTQDETLVQESLRYLNSEGAKRSLEADPYWPKWDSPWWHMTVLYEIGHAKRIPRNAVNWLLSSLKRHLLPVFLESEIPAGADPFRNVPCPCQIGNTYQILGAVGVDVDAEIPWMRPWLLRYQMQDGGLSCDETAYKASPQASSIVGTIAPLEAILFCTKRAYTSEEIQFLDRGAHCLLERRLIHGCSAPHNAGEREDEKDWLKLCFPRFYFYDVLRGLNFVMQWSDLRNQKVPLEQIKEAFHILETQFLHDEVRVGRNAFEVKTTLLQSSSGEWLRQQPASHFPLLDHVSEIGKMSPFLTERFSRVKQLRDVLIKKGSLA